MSEACRPLKNPVRDAAPAYRSWRCFYLESRANTRGLTLKQLRELGRREFIEQADAWDWLFPAPSYAQPGSSAPEMKPGWFFDLGQEAGVRESVTENYRLFLDFAGLSLNDDTHVTVSEPLASTWLATPTPMDRIVARVLCSLDAVGAGPYGRVLVEDGEQYIGASVGLRESLRWITGRSRPNGFQDVPRSWESIAQVPMP